MTTTRRTFMRQMGVSLAAVLTSGCIRTCYTPTPPVTCYTTVAPTLTLDTTDSRWRNLQACWLDLDDPRFQSAQADEFATTLRRRHQTALDALVSEGSLSADVATEIGVAFEEAVAHLWGKLSTCYGPLMEGEANPYPQREDLILQAAALTEMAQRSDIDPATVARTQATLKQDIAWLSQFHAGQHPDDINTIAASPAEIEAARILVELLLGRK